MKRASFLFLLGVIFCQLSLAETSAPGVVQSVQKKSWSFLQLGLTPIQSGGRVKPLDSYAREIILFETGSRSYKGWNPLDLLFSWMAHPEYWEKVQFIQVGREDVRRQLSLDEKRTLFSPDELRMNSALAQYGESQQTPTSEAPTAAKPDQREQELKAVLERVGLFYNLVAGQGWLLIPKPEPQAWGSVLSHDPEGQVIREQFIQLLKSYHDGDQAAFTRSSTLFKAAVEGEISNYPDRFRSKIEAESLYNRMRPFLWAWILYLGAGVVWSVQAAVSKRKKSLTQIALGLTSGAIIMQVLGIGLRCFVAGRPPVTNMYESVIWVSLGVVIFAVILYGVHRQAVILAVASFLALLGLVAGDAAPAILDPSIHPLVPVLRSNYWLTIHVLTITLGYAAFALAFGLANITLFQYLRRDRKKSSKPGAEFVKKINGLNQLTYRAIQFGVVLIAAGTILGGVWADYSWGRFWGWDPKEVWALITLLCYLVILHGRYTSWVGQFGFAVWSAMSFLSVVMAWYGVNFILGVGLHSYGFATGGTPWVIGFVLLQIFYVGSIALLHRARS